jgi:hypothetical protein
MANRLSCATVSSRRRISIRFRRRRCASCSLTASTSCAIPMSWPCARTMSM